jgi:hypothetical protein
VVLVNIFHYLFYELTVVKWKTNMHYVTGRDRCGLIDIYAKRLIPALHDPQQRIADFAQAYNDNCLLHTLR